MRTNFPEMKKMAAAALPIDDDEWGSERQVEAANAFFIALEKCLPKCYMDDVEEYALKATTEEMVAYGMATLKRHAEDYASFKASSTRTHNLARYTGMVEDTEGFVYSECFYINFTPGNDNAPDEYHVLIGNTEEVFDNIDSAEWHLWSEFVAEQEYEDRRTAGRARIMRASK